MITLGHDLLVIALAAAAWSMIAAPLAALSGARGLQRSAERALLVSTGGIAGASLALVACFLMDDFRVRYVYLYSSSEQALQFKIGALWGGQAGSLLFWALILGVMASVMVLTNRNKNRSLMPTATAVVGLTMVFFLVLVNFIENPFLTQPAPPDGVGLNPQLKNYWMMIHPPALYLGYVAFTIPFAFAIAALVTRRTGDVWFRTTRRWTLFGWFFLGAGILMGSYWAYIELGWGGYWAWDPVENASLMPWLTGTAFLHSVMIQERKGMLKIWNMVLIILTFSLSIFGTFLTRSGIISSVHSFATSNIGPAFGAFLAVIFFGSLGLLIFRLETLRSKARLESLLSRESSFLFNNLILVGIAATVLLLTTFPMFSEAITGRKVTMGPPIFNLVNIPWAIVLLLLVGVGPLIAWRKASTANLKRNFTWPGLVGLWVLLALLALDLTVYGRALGSMGSALVSLDVRGAFEQLRVFYPPMVFGIGAFVLGTVVLELSRGIRSRRHQRGESLPSALAGLMWHQKRRWGGYIVHVGVVVIFFGIAGSAAYQKETVKVMEPGQTLAVDGYQMRYEGFRLEAVDDHISAIAELSVFRDGRFFDRLESEQRYHPNMMFQPLREAFEQAETLGEQGDPGYEDAVRRVYATIASLEQRAGREVKTPSTEVGLLASWSLASPGRIGEDFYVIPLALDPQTGRANFRVFVNPMVNFIWLGGLILVVGAHLSVLPDRRDRKQLEAAMRVEGQAIA